MPLPPFSVPLKSCASRHVEPPTIVDRKEQFFAKDVGRLEWWEHQLFCVKGEHVGGGARRGLREAG